MASTAAPGARLEHADEDRLSLILPGDWARIPLESEEASNQEISRLLRRQVPRRDELAAMRRDAREMMRGLANDAREAEAILLALSLELLPGLPFAAAIIAHYIPEPQFDEQLPLELQLAVVQQNGEVVELDCGLVARLVERDLPGPDEPDASIVIRFQYLMPTPFVGRWIQLYANVPTELDPELVTALFDAIVGTVRWFPDEAAEA